MTYTGNPLQLINTPTTALPAGYTMKYAVTTENTAPADNLYTTSIPTAIGARTYYVWYRVYVDDNNTSDPTLVTVEISPVDKAELNKAIKEAEAEVKDIDDTAAAKKNFRVYVVTYKIIDGKKVKLGKSTVVHLVGSKNKKYSNVKKLTLKKKKYTVKVGKKKKIKAKVTLVNRNKKHIPKSHGTKFRYKSSDTGIAAVSKKGKIKGIKKGKCTIYVYSINALMKKAKVIIK